MKTKKIGRFVVSIELDRVEGSMKYYDAVIDRDGHQVKICKGCIGEKSGDYWGAYLEKLAKKLDILYDRRDMACHNLLCYSKSYLMDEPKESYEAERKAAKEEADFLEIWIKELET